MTGKIEPGEFVYVQGAIYRKDWSRFDQRDDYSFNADADSYIDWDKMTDTFQMYLHGELNQINLTDKSPNF